MTGRPVRGFIGGFLLGIFLDIDLVFLGIVNLSSVLLTILPLVLLVIGLLLGLWAPVGRNPQRVPPPNFAAPTAPSPPPPVRPASTTTGLPTAEDSPPV
jgi:hypothetical protein